VAKLEEKYQNVLQVNLMRNPNQQKNWKFDSEKWFLMLAGN
jgi:hypothetical protein